MKLNKKKSNDEPVSLKKEKKRKVNLDKAKKKEDKNRKKRIKESSTILEIMPFVNYDELQGCIITSENNYVDMLQIIPKDLTNVGKDVINHDALSFQKLYKIYGDDLKFIFTNSPTDVTMQLKYFENKIKKTINPVHLASLEEKRAELLYLAKKRTSREFFVMLFSNSLEESIKNMNILKGALGSLAREINIEKKTKILFKLANKNILVF